MAPRMIAARKANEITVTIVKVVVARIAEHDLFDRDWEQ
jgi:hypothetical protein